MAAPWDLGFLLVLLGSPLALAEPLYILVAPRAMRVGSPENIHVQAHPDSAQMLRTPLAVTVTVWEFPLRNTMVDRRQLVLSPENDFMVQFSVTLPESLVFPPKPGQQYVVIRATWAPGSDSSFMEKTVLVVPHAGYIFIQTDKTIYTPDHLVYYRVFTVNHRMDPVPGIFTLDIKNPEGVTVTSQSLKVQEGFFENSFQLPELVSLGTWTMEASYQSTPQQKFKATFDVKEYVLPSFEVQLKPNKTFFYFKDEALGVDIQARYIFNRPVDGQALAIFGVKMDSRRMPLESSLQRVEVSKGHGHVSLQRDKLMSIFEGPKEALIGASIFVNVTVFSSAGEMVQVEISGVKIVETPYHIWFTRTPQYFKPGMPFLFRVFVSNPDGSPASGVLVHCQSYKAYTSKDGVATLTINTDANLEKLPILVETDDSRWPKASARMTALPYSTQDESGNFLHIEVNTLGTEVSSRVQLSLNTRHRYSGTKDKITHFTILVLSKSQIISAKHQSKTQGSVYTSAVIDVTPEMLPSFRILAFYLLPKGASQDPELVADSVWIDVNDKCMGTLKVGLKDDGLVQTLDPNSKVELKVTGDAEATVGLVAVDKAVYVLNSKHKLTQKKVWDVVEEYDIGCTAGSGKDRFAVFKDAGLDLKISTGMGTQASSDWRCPQNPPPSRRRRHSLKRLEQKRNAVNKFKTELERKCCEAGLRDSPVGLSCRQRTSHVRHGPACVAAFLDCCRLSKTLTREAREEHLLLGTTADEDEDFDDLFLDDLPVRTWFPESRLWKLTLPKSNTGSVSHHILSMKMPDSITTWQFVAISVKAGRGICVSDPFELTVTKTFFVDLKLPPSVVRNEQVQIQAVLYNFHDRHIKVRVEFPYKEPLCSTSKPEAPFRQVVVVPPTSTKTVPFVLLPLETGKVDVEVKALGFGAEDHVKKTLLVREGGQVEKIFQSIFLDPKGQTQKELVPKQHFLDKMPSTEAEVFVSVQGDILGESILGGLTSRETSYLLTVPDGCPEQTLSKMARVVILTNYLDASGQWGRVGPEHRQEVMKNIVKGYTRMLSHRNEDGTYHVSKGSPGSTWLTSYVFRIFVLAYPMTTVKVLDLPSLCAMARWIVTQRQADDGHFVERGPVVMASMQGGYQGSEADVSLTALVLIALAKGKELCSPKMPNLTGSMERARGFLETQLPSIQTTFAMAIASYALALADSPRANDRLDSFASPNKTHWPVSNLGWGSSYTIEATAYALMQKLELGRYNETQAIAKWLVEQRELGGFFRSTQTTIVTLEALTRFSQAAPFEGTQDLHVQISVPKRDLSVQWFINQNNAYYQRSAKGLYESDTDSMAPNNNNNKFSSQDDLEITASGSGSGTVSILTMYHRSPESWEGNCNLYSLNVTLNSVPEENRKGEETFQLRMETRYQSNRDATMTILEISLLTGFYPNHDDLKQLTSDVERYAFQYETKTGASNSTVVLYLEKLSHEKDTVLGFRVHRMLQAELLQAALVTIYDYYEPAQRCSAFYNLPTEHSSLRKICHRDICRCAEEQCPSLRKASRQLRQEELQAAACEAGVDYVYKVKLETVEASASNPYVYYNMQLEAIIKSGTDPAVPLTVKKFVSHATCRDALRLQEQKSYLIMGQMSDLWKVKSEYTYVLGKETFLMLWPAEGDVDKKDLADELQEFSGHLSNRGCES